MSSNNLLAANGLTGQIDTLINVLNITSREFDINECDKFGWTALHYAAFYQHTTVIDKLIELGADINLQSRGNETPKNILESHQYFAL